MTRKRRRECRPVARGLRPTGRRSQRLSETLTIRTAESWRKGANFCKGLGCQLLVDEANQIIVAQGAANNAADNGNFGPMVEIRKSVVEPTGGQIKEIGGFRRPGLRGYRKVRREWALVCTGCNLKKLIGAMQAGQCKGRTLG
jgi:hypothetical protein